MNSFEQNTEIVHQALKKLIHDPLFDFSSPSLKEAVVYNISHPGKCLRPILFLQVCEMLNLPVEKMISAGLAIEMIHLFTLIHDDLPCMDNDLFRRGRPSTHHQFGESTALLAGNVFLTQALHLFLQTPLPSEQLFKGLKRLLNSITLVIQGQSLESELSSHSLVTDLMNMYQGKTGALFLAAVLIPFDFLERTSDIDPKTDLEESCLQYFGDSLGKAFQIADDLSDQPFTSAPPIHHILHFFSPEDSQEYGQKILTRSMQSLEEFYGKKSHGCLLFAEKILHLLEKNSFHTT